MVNRASVNIVRRRAASAFCAPATMNTVLARVYAARGVVCEGDVDYSLRTLLPPNDLPCLQAAAELLSETVRQGKKILVVGDFDADGATSVAVALRGLRSMGHDNIDYLVPNRFEYGYGLTPEIVGIATTYSPHLIMTVDNGISSIDGVKAAKDAGIRVLITDHHLPGEILPAADVILNPNLPDHPEHFRELAGVGVVFYLLAGTRALLRAGGWFSGADRPPPNLSNLLDLVALGTVADVVPLNRNNRVLVAHGIARIRAGLCVPGIGALLQVGKRDPARVIASDLGFAVGPRLNAAGRLEDMSLGIECLLTEDRDVARRFALELDGLNRKRKEIESDMQQQAMSAVSVIMEKQSTPPFGVCLFEPDWHVGVVGIVAARIKDKLHRPVIAFARQGKAELKGSARSIKGLHIKDVLESVHSLHPGLIERFGGHAMAAGLSLKLENLAQFRNAFDQCVRARVTEKDLSGALASDGELLGEELSLETAQALRDGGPWGQGFPEPMFDGEFSIREKRLLGGQHLKLLLETVDGCLLDGIAFRVGNVDWLESVRRVKVAYRLDVNEYRGVRSAQLVIEHIEPV